MRYVQSGLGIVAVLVVLAASGAMNAHFWLGQGKSVLEGQILAAVSVAADLLKALLPFFVAGAFEHRRFVRGVVGSGLFVVVFAFSVFSALGFVATSRSALWGSREALSARASTVTAELAEVDARIVALGAIQDVGMVEAALARHKLDPRWQSTKDCREAPGPRQREYCTEHFGLQGQLAAATSAKPLLERQAVLRRQAQTLRARGAGQVVDPQASLLAKLIPATDAPMMQTVVMLLVVATIELTAAFGLWMATAGLYRQGGDGRPERGRRSGVCSSGRREPHITDQTRAATVIRTEAVTDGTSAPSVPSSPPPAEEAPVNTLATAVPPRRIAAKPALVTSGGKVSARRSSRGAQAC